MASITLGAVGSAVGGAIGGPVGAYIGGAIGSSVGAAVDSWVISQFMPGPEGQRIEGQRLDSVKATSSAEGAVIPRVHGRFRIGANIIWATDFREEVREETQGGGGGKGGGGRQSPEVTTVTYHYFASFAAAVCEGPIAGIGRIWADGKLIEGSGSRKGNDIRVYLGTEDQQPDTFIKSKSGAAHTPAYRGTAYVMFEDFPLADYGNRIPQLSFEVFRTLDDADAAEGMTRAVTVIPATGVLSRTWWSFGAGVVSGH